MRAGYMSMIAAALLLGGSMSARAFQMSPAPAAAPPAAAAPAPAPAVDVAACQACHGANGISRSTHVPNLAGQQGDYLVAQLQAFRAGTRKNDLMEAIAAQLSDAEMTALGAYYSSHPAGDPHDPAATASAGPAIPSRMSFPAGFPAGFTMYQSVPGEGGAATERWANAAAMRAARAGVALPDGSAIVVVNRAAPATGASGPGAVTGYAGMEARAGWGAAIPALLRNGNWDYAVFSAAGARNARLNQAQCLACHRPAAANSHVFTLPALRARAAQ